jgi:hypothetical protein
MHGSHEIVWVEAASQRLGLLNLNRGETLMLRVHWHIDTRAPVR